MKRNTENSSMGGSTSLADFLSVTDVSIEKVVHSEIDKINSHTDDPRAKMTDREIQGFAKLFSRYLREKSTKKKLDWNLIESPSSDLVKPYSSLPSCEPSEVNQLLKKLAVLKLNGGLGTTMGCVGPKSVIEVRGETTFLDLIVQQIEHINRKYPEANVPLLLMNSFNTDADTAKIIKKYQDTQVTIMTFQQSRFPRILKDSLQPFPLTHSSYNREDWYPPGHGDLFESIESTGIIDTLLAQGKEYLFISNVDNLGATVDLNILKMINDSGCEYCMELTDKTRADVKGGTLISYDGQVTLLEVAQVPKEHTEEFKSVKKFKVFNTNNIWLNLRAVKKRVKEGKMDLDIIANTKTVGDQKVIQLETAVGSAIRYFENARGVNVPRSRFLPVKSTSDLLLVQSNLYTLKSGTLIPNPLREFNTTPVVKLGPEFQKVADYNARFETIPDLLELDHLTVSGDVSFGSGVKLKGTVIIVASRGNKIMIPSGSVLENKILSGNLYIMDH
eukprot:jgi/Galph1/5955/GphlegSOOS_G4545.1